MDTEVAARIVNDQFRTLAPASVASLGEGCDNVAFEVNGAWVFRFPKRDDVEEQLLLEARLLPLLSRGSPLPIPEPRFHGLPSPEFPRHFLGYPKLSGTAAIQLAPMAVAPLAYAPVLARFLSWLHAFPVIDADRCGVPRQPTESLIQERRTEAIDDYEFLINRAPEVTRPSWREALEQAGVSDAPPSLATLVHNDLAAEHVLVGETTALITGIIDWSDVETGDPAVDFGGLYHWGGEPFLKAVLSFYERPTDEGLARRARFLGLCRGVGDVRFGVETSREEYIAAGLRALERSGHSPSTSH